MAGLSKWAWVKALGAALFAVLGGLFYWSGRRIARKAGEETGHIREDYERLREAAERGDDDAVLKEWRRR